MIFGSPDIGEDEIDAVVKVLKSGWIGTGPKCSEFQENFSNYKKVKNSIAVNSATAALHLSLKALGLQKGDEVITTANTFCATINSIIHAGGTPVLVDIRKNTLNINPDLIEEKITEKTKVIIPVHFAGLSCEMDKILKIAKKYDLKIIEDCAHAIETIYEHKPVGTFGDFGCFSFYATKNIVTAEGGMVITNNEINAEKIKILSLHGMNRDAWKRFGSEGYKHYDVTEVGFKYNMTDIQAAIGNVQLSTIEKKWEKRKKIFNFYNSELKNLNIELPHLDSNPNNKQAYHLYPIRIKNNKNKNSRDKFIEKMKGFNIGVGVHYQSIATYSIYKELYNWIKEDYKESLEYGEETVSIPISSKLSDDDIEYIVNVIKKIL